MSRDQLSRSTEEAKACLNAAGTSLESRQIELAPDGSSARSRSASPPIDERKMACACTLGSDESAYA